MIESNVCNNCGKGALATDTICWHCGAKLPKAAIETIPDPDADLLAQERSKTAVYIYAALFAFTVLALMGTLYALGKRPLFVLNGKTERPAGWTAVTDQSQTFTLNLPPNWEWLDNSDEMMDVLFEGDEGMKMPALSAVETAVLPFLTSVPDSKLTFIAQQEAESPFLLVLHGDALAQTSPRQLIAAMKDEPSPTAEIVDTSIIENSLTGDQADFRINFPEQAIRCQYRHVQAGYLLVACADEGEYGRYTADLFNMLSSFQPLNN